MKNSDVQCECPDGLEDVFCERHGVVKTWTQRAQCRKGGRHWEAWESGAFAESAEPKAPPEQRRPRKRSCCGQAWDLAKALATFVADGCRTVTAEEYRARLEVCDQCDLLDPKRGRCRSCGCKVRIKARGRAWQCPEGFWPNQSSD